MPTFRFSLLALGMTVSLALWLPLAQAAESVLYQAQIPVDATPEAILSLQADGQLKLDECLNSGTCAPDNCKFEKQTAHQIQAITRVSCADPATGGGPEDSSGSWIAWVAGTVALQLRGVLELVLGWLVGLCDWVLKTAFFVPGNLKAVWMQLRDFVNIVFALVLMLVAVFNIVQARMDSYAIRKILPGFVAAVVFVNFSWVICMWLLDLGNIAYHAVLSLQPEAGSLTALIDQAALRSLTTVSAGAADYSASWSWACVAILSFVIYLGMVAVLVELFFVLLAWIVILWLLITVSPLAWIGVAVPDARAETWGRFWNLLLTAVILPAKVTFFLVLGLMLQNAFLTRAGVQQMNLSSGGWTEMDPSGNFAQSLLGMGVAAVCIFIAAKSALSTEFTAGALKIGSRVGVLARNATGRVMQAGAALPLRAAYQAVKQGRDAFKNPVLKTSGKAAAVWQAAGRAATKTAAGTVGDLVNPGRYLDAGRRVAGSIKGNLEAANKAENIALAQKIGSGLDRLGGGEAASRAGLDGSLESSLRRELTAEYRDSIRKSEYDVLNHGTTNELTVRLQSIQDNDLLSQVRREELINALYKKAEFMNQAEVKTLQKIMNEANRKDSKLLRNEFKNALKDITGIMRAANPFFTNARIDPSGFKGFGRQYDLSKINLKTAMNANIGDFADMIDADPSLAKKQIQQSLIDTFSDATRRAEREVTDDAYRAMKRIEPSIR